jgi:hypothetical protein
MGISCNQSSLKKHDKLAECKQITVQFQTFESES